MKSATRQQKIVEFAQRDRNGEVDVEQLASLLNVSVMTIRRDLTVLCDAGKLSRTHGGAVLSQTSSVAFTFTERGQAHGPEKQAIAQAVADKVAPGMTVVIDTGTTCLEVARAVSHVNDLTVLTSSLPIASVLYAQDNIKLVLLGGVARRGNPDLSGPLTDENLRKFRPDIAIVGADGLCQHGIYTEDMGVAAISQSMISLAETAILVADSSKFNAKAFVKFAEWKDLDFVMTDKGVGPKERQWLAKTTCKLICAE